MSFRRRITIAAAAAVAVAVVLASVITYVLVRRELRGEIDSSLRNRAQAFMHQAHGPPQAIVAALSHSQAGRQLLAASRHNRTFLISNRRRDRRREDRQGANATALVVSTPSGPRAIPAPLAELYRPIPVRPGESGGFAQLVTGSGAPLSLPSSDIVLPVLAQTRALVRRGSGSALADATVDDQHLRVLSVGIAPGSAIELARSLTEVDSALNRVRVILVLMAAGGIALAAILGRFVAGAVVAPVRRLTRTAEHVAETQDLGQRIEFSGRDELSSLAQSFNAMLDALAETMGKLDASARTQRQLVADASHELRTPVTSVRTNIDVLHEQGDSLPASERKLLVADAAEQLDDLSVLIGDLIELAREDEPHEEPEELRFDTLVAEAIDRARRHSPAARFDATLEETLVRGVAARLDRAVANLLENAIKFAGTERAIEVRLTDGELTVRDHGPGLDPEELPHLFDRFYRGSAAHGRTGSGLGLAIVRQVADAHGGSVGAETAPEGGTIMRLRLPLADS